LIGWLRKWVFDRRTSAAREPQEDRRSPRVSRKEADQRLQCALQRLTCSVSNEVKTRK